MGESSRTLAIASHLKLKGRANYRDQRPAIEAVIKGNGLGKQFRKIVKVPVFVNKDNEKVDKDKLKVYLEQEEFDAKAQLLIMNSTLSEPTGVIKGKTTALEIQEALEHQY